MALWKQGCLAALVVAAALVGWALFVPSALPWLARAGLLEPMQRIGLIAAAPQDAPQGGGPGGQGGAPTVIAAEVETVVLNDVITAVGSARGARSVILGAEVEGQVTAINVAAGQMVEAGVVVVELDSQAAQIVLDRATLILGDAQATQARVAQLQVRGAVTDLQVQEADLALKTAGLQAREAQFELDRHRIVAPISGWVGILDLDVGDRVTPGVEITRLEDRSSLIVDFRVPERVVSRLKLGDAVSATPLADPALTLEGRITALDNRVDEASRSLLVQAAIPNADDALRSGMAFSIALQFTGANYPAVDPLAIQWGAAGAFVWIVRDGKAVQLPLRIVQRNSDAVLIAADLLPGDQVVTEGVQALRPGVDVTVVPSDGAEAAITDPRPTRI